MSATESVSAWIDLLKAGDHAAAQHLWERYYQRLVGLARRNLRGAARQVADEEDVALSAFASFCQGAEHGRFPQLLDRDDLWQLLVVLTARKAAHQKRAQRQRKRGGDQAGTRLADEAPALSQVIGHEPTPAFAAQVAEECQRLLDRLGDPSLRAVAVAKMDGYRNDEIATQLGCGLRTVERKLQVIRGLWEQEVDQP
jgi:DNA-directed RNA polymerase specialized sigma24 family protein